MATFQVGYQQQTTVVGSSSVPVSLIPPGFISNMWSIRLRTAATGTILIFAYTGALPGSAPANVMEVAAGVPIGDRITSAQNGADDGIGSGWAAVLTTGSTAVTADALWR